MKLSIYKLLNKLKTKTFEEPDTIGLKPLYPEKERTDHCLYVDELNHAIKDPRVLNIALTGNYGSGKSSILSDFEKKKEKRVIRVSLSTLGGGIESEHKDGTERAKSNKELANSIQKEIVKQLLFREKPSQVPNSKYSRIAATNLARTFLLSTLLAITTILFIYYPWNMNAPSVMGVDGLWQIGVDASIFLIVFSLTSLIILATNGKLVISKLTGKLGGGSITLAPSKNNNYFDEHLDEIVYFFEVSTYDVVILEDIERFNNSYIFETLRQLNALLNDSGQIRAKKKSIRFIYAVKDSLFKEDFLDVYEQSTNRAKFFDLIVPVVPFITHQTGNDLISKMFNADGKMGISEDLISITANHITDMRLIKNIRNEYLIFAKKLLGEDKLEGLSPDKLFAMVVYKNTYLEDFEKIKRGKSNLDKIYRSYRSRITKNIKELREKIDANNAKLDLPESIAARSGAYGERLVSFLQISLSGIQANNISYTLQGINFTEDEISEATFWEKVRTLGASDNFVASYTTPGQYSSPLSKTMSLSRTNIEAIIGSSIDFDTLEKEDKQILRQENRQLRNELRGAPYKNIQQIFDSSPEFKESVEKILGEGIAFDLLSSGYIDVNYLLYTSIFHGTNPKAVNFVVHHLQTNQPDIHYKFNGDDNIKVLLDKYGSAYLRDKSIYNIDILDYLLAAPNNINTETHALSHISTNLVHGEPEDLELIGEYMQSGKHREKLIETLSSRWKSVFSYVTNTDEVDNEQRPKLFNAALRGAGKDFQYEVDERTTSYVIQNADELDVLTLPANKTAKEKMASVLKQIGAKLTSLERLSDDILKIIVNNNLYVISQKTLEAAAKSKNLSLDNLLAINEDIFIYVADNLPIYLGILQDSKQTKHTIDSNEHFVPILSHIAQSGAESLAEVVRRASKDCRVENIADAPPEAWGTLLDTNSVPSTFKNIYSCFKSNGENTLDQITTEFLLRSQSISLDGNENTDDKRVLAIAILIDEYIGAEIKVKLVSDLKLDTVFTAEDIGTQEGSLFGLLVANEMLSDSAETYNYLKNLNVETRLNYIENSKAFLSYIQDTALNVDEINAISSSSDVSDEIKMYIVNNLATYDEEISIDSVTNFANFALKNSMSLSEANLRVIVDGPDETTSVKLTNLAGDIERDNFVEILAVIGKGYEKLAQPKKRITLDHTDYNLSLVERVKSLGMVSSYTEEEYKGKSILRVNMKKDW
jgi:hypothetical protein